MAWLPQPFVREPPQLPLQFSQCPLRVCVVTQPPCAVLGAGGDVEQSVNPPSAPWLFCARALELPGGTAGTGLCCHCLALSVLWCCVLAAAVGSVGLLPCPVQSRGRGAVGELRVSAEQPLPSPWYSSYLFIEMSQCGEVQKSKLAPERP